MLREKLFPLQYKDGCVCDKDGNVLLRANRESGTTPLAPYQRDYMMKNVCELLNRQHTANGAYVVIYEEKDGGINTTEFRGHTTEQEAMTDYEYEVKNGASFCILTHVLRWHETI